MNKNINLFVYGSLREGFFNYEKYLQGKVISITPAVLSDMDLYHMPYKGYPAITKGTGKILGEIVVVENYEDTISAIDKMEGFISENNPSNEYHKTLLDVKYLDEDKAEQCFVYFYNKDIDKKFNDEAVYIAHGDWKKHMLETV